MPEALVNELLDLLLGLIAKISLRSRYTSFFDESPPHAPHLSSSELSDEGRSELIPPLV